MPLPVSDTQWPPPQVCEIYEAICVWDAWFTGDVAQLEAQYATANSQVKAGLWGGIRRMFWGTPNPTNVTQPPVKIHHPVASEIARMSAQQLFGEMFAATFENDHDNDDTVDGHDKPIGIYDDANARLAEMLDDNAHARFLEAAEFAAAHGGSYIKIAWDQATHADGPFLQVMASDSAVPEFKFGILTAVTFWSQLAPIGKQAYTLLERHEPGTIEYGLYETSTKGQLGIRVPLATHPDVESLASIVNADSLIETGSPLLTAVYLPNVKPNRKWRRDPIGMNLGRSDFDGAEDLMDSLDEAYTSYMRDFRLGKTRIMVPKGMLNTLGPGQGAQFNADQEVFTELGEMVGSMNTGAPGAAESFIKTFQPTIRYLEHQETVVHLKEAIYAACGYSAQSFGEAGDVAITATEAMSREKLTILTRSAKILAAKPQLVNLLAALMDVDAFVFDGPGRDGIFPQIEFPDSSSENPQVLAQTLRDLVLAEAVSVQTRVEMLHADWDEEQVLKEVDRIRDDYSLLPDPTMAHLWAAEAGNASATGGVDATKNGVAPGAQTDAAASVDKQIASDETASDNSLNAPKPGQ